jgi:hypothetical protein
MMMGMGVAAGMGQQMAGMMSGGMNAMQQPMQQPQAPQMAPPPMPGATSYMLAVNGQQYGPYNMQQLQQMAQSGQINSSTLVWAPGMPQWASAGSVPELANLFMPTPSPVPPVPPMP